jgi:hypothetical protein
MHQSSTLIVTTFWKEQWRKTPRLPDCHVVTPQTPCFREEQKQSAAQDTCDYWMLRQRASISELLCTKDYHTSVTTECCSKANAAVLQPSRDPLPDMLHHKQLTAGPAYCHQTGSDVTKTEHSLTAAL